MFYSRSMQLVRAVTKSVKTEVPIVAGMKGKDSSLRGKKLHPRRRGAVIRLSKKELQRLVLAQTPNKPIEKDVVYTEWMNDMPEDHTHDKLDK